MVRRAAQVTARAAHLDSGARTGESPVPLLIKDPQAQAPNSPEIPRDRMTCLAHYWLVFSDPKWGPVSMELSIWRDDQTDMPDYTVIVD